MSAEEGDGIFYGEIQDLGNGLSMVAVLQGFVAVAGAVAFFADGFDAFHEGHVGDDDAFAFAGGAGSKAIERE